MSEILTTVIVFGGAYVAYKVYEKAKYEYEFNEARKKFSPFSCGKGIGKIVKDPASGNQIKLFSKTECDAMNADSFFPNYGFTLGGECLKSPSVYYPSKYGGSFSGDCGYVE